MEFYTKVQCEKLMANWPLLDDDEEGLSNMKPVVKLFNPTGPGTWLLCAIDPESPDIAFGLCDLGMGCPELGSVSLQELRELRLPFGLTIERDLHVTFDRSMGEYASKARREEGIYV